MTVPLVIEAGRRYRRADGTIRGPMRQNPDDEDLCWIDQDGITYTRCGHYFVNGQDHPNDLIFLVPASSEKQHDDMTLDDWRRSVEAMGFLR